MEEWELDILCPRPDLRYTYPAPLPRESLSSTFRQCPQQPQPPPKPRNRLPAICSCIPPASTSSETVVPSIRTYEMVTLSVGTYETVAPSVGTSKMLVPPVATSEPSPIFEEIIHRSLASQSSEVWHPSTGHSSYHRPPGKLLIRLLLPHPGRWSRSPPGQVRQGTRTRLSIRLPPSSVLTGSAPD